MEIIAIFVSSQLTVSALQCGQLVNGFLYSGWCDSPKQGGEVIIVELQRLLWNLSQRLEVLRDKKLFDFLRGCLLLPSLGVDVERERGEVTNQEGDLDQGVSGAVAVD